jgi:hypothetical protein
MDGRRPMAGNEHVRGREGGEGGEGCDGRWRCRWSCDGLWARGATAGDKCVHGAVDDGCVPIAMLLVCDRRVSSSAALGDDGCGG